MHESESLGVQGLTRADLEAVGYELLVLGVYRPLAYFAAAVTLIVEYRIKILSLQHQNIKVMIVNFNEDYLRDLYRSGKSDKKHRFQPQIVRKYIRVIDLMISEDNVQGLWKYNSLNYERLEGNKEGLSSVRVNDQYRIEFEEEFEDGQTIATICNITELSNHYK